MNEIRAALTRGDAGVAMTERASGVSRTDGQLSFFDNAVDSTPGTITLKASFENTDHALWPGQFVQVQIRLGVDRGAVVVPSAAVQIGQNSAQVYVVKPDKSIDIRIVKVLRTAGDSTLLGEGVRPGETVVTDGHLRLTPSSRVEVKTLSSVMTEAPKQKAESK